MMPRRIRRYLSSRPLLLALLAVDAGFIALHLWLWWIGALTNRYNLASNPGIPERFQYLKWFACFAACAWAFYRQKSPLYLAWTALFAYLLADDAWELHERLGTSLSASLALGPAFALRAMDFGELIVSAVAGSVLLGTIAVLYARSADEQARRFTRSLLPPLAVLALCGIVVDMLHMQIGMLIGHGAAYAFAGVLEDGGEMVAASFLTAICVTAIRQ